jgi:NADH dehydrogenase
MRVAVFGAGYAGVTAARRLEDRLPDDVELVLVDDDGEHLLQHELHRLVRYPELADVVTFPVEELLDRAEIREATVTDLDPAAGVANLDGERFEYDAGVVTVGAEPAFYDLPGVEEYGTPLKRTRDAEAIREEFLALASEGRNRVVVGGAGLSGIQIAGELAALARRRELDPEIVLLEMADTIAPNFPENFREAVREELLEREVEVRTGRRIEEATEEAIVTDRGSVAYDQFVWTGGIRGDESVGGERPVVNRTLRLEGATFGAGDAVKVIDRDGQAAPASAQTAIRQAPVAAENVAKLVDHRTSNQGGFEPRLDSYSYDSLGWVVSVGDGTVAQVGPAVFRGRAAKALKTSIGAGYLSSVGAVREAVELVNEELGIADDVDSEAPVEGDDNA